MLDGLDGLDELEGLDSLDELDGLECRRGGLYWMGRMGRTIATIIQPVQWSRDSGGPDCPGEIKKQAARRGRPFFID